MRIKVHERRVRSLRCRGEVGGEEAARWTIKQGAAVPVDGAGLRRALTLTHIVLYGLGVTIGAGIYVLIGAAAARAGMHVPVAFVLAAILMALTASSFAELGGRIPLAAGEAAYAREAFGSDRVATAVGLLLTATIASVRTGIAILERPITHPGRFLIAFTRPTRNQIGHTPADTKVPFKTSKASNTNALIRPARIGQRKEAWSLDFIMSPPPRGR